MRTHRPGRHELGQNFLIDRNIIEKLVRLVAAIDGPIIEFGTGDGALTLPLERLGRSLTGIEIDDRRAARLAGRVRASTEIVTADFLRFPLPKTPYVLVGNLPFHLTTATLRHVLAAPGWTDAVLLVQWEVARRRAGVGGATMLTAQWWPWFDFGLVGRVPRGGVPPQARRRRRSAHHGPSRAAARRRRGSRALPGLRAAGVHAPRPGRRAQKPHRTPVG